MAERVHITKSDPAESAELLAKSVVQVAEASRTMLDAGLSRRALVVLLHDAIGPQYITKKQINLVLDALPQLKGWYARG